MSNRIQQIYLALFGRPADPGGMAFYDNLTNNGANLNLIIGTQATQPEYVNRFQGKTDTQIVNSIFQALFGRDADPTGLDFYASRLTNHTFTIETIAIRILDGATTGTDAAVLLNKLTAANLFTSHLDLQVETSAYVGDAAADVARGIITPIGADPSTVPSSDTVDLTILQLVNAGHTPTVSTFAEGITGAPPGGAIVLDTSSTQVDGVDVEKIIVTANSNNDDVGSYSVQYRINGVLHSFEGIFGIGAASNVNVNSSDEIASFLVNQFNSSGLPVHAEQGFQDSNNVIISTTHPGDLLAIDSVTLSAAGGLSAVKTDGADTQEVVTLAYTGAAPQVGETYTIFLLTPAGSDFFVHTVGANETGNDVAADLISKIDASIMFNAQDPTGVGSNQIQIMAQVPNNGGFTWSVASTGAGGVVGSPSDSPADANDLGSIVSVANFVRGSDVVTFTNTVDDVVGTGDSTFFTINSHGLVTFAGNVTALHDKVAQLTSDITITGGETVAFVHDGDTYVYNAGDVNDIANDSIIKLTGVVATIGLVETTGDHFIVA